MAKEHCIEFPSGWSDAERSPNSKSSEAFLVGGADALPLHPRLMAACSLLLDVPVSELELTQCETWVKFGSGCSDDPADNQDQRIHMVRKYLEDVCTHTESLVLTPTVQIRITQTIHYSIRALGLHQKRSLAWFTTIMMMLVVELQRLQVVGETMIQVISGLISICLVCGRMFVG